ncbi:MAG: DNA repair protein RecN [Chloroflexota bacterium]
MLLELAVADLALLERVRIRLGPGLTVLTGETGAGKSLLIDALLLVLGGRADSSLVRSGAAEARVEAVFDGDPEPLIAVREVAAGGRSLARLDDATVTAARLAATVAARVEIHGQHDQQRLLAADFQRDLLDACGGHDAERAAVRAAVDAWRTNAALLAELAAAPDALDRRRELAAWEADEIAAARIRPGEIAELRARLAAVASVERLARHLAGAEDALTGEGSGAYARIAAAARDLADAARVDARLAPLAARAVGLAAEADDLAHEVRSAGSDLDAAAEASPALEQRLADLYTLLRKYGEDEETVVAHGARMQAEAERLAGAAAERAERAAADARLRSTADTAAAALGARRRATAHVFAAAVDAALGELGFAPGAFAVAVADAPLGADGADSVTFLLAANPGEPPRPLARIASGGELSRIALAIRGVAAAADATPTVVFDEIDTGIGGRSAEPVGRMLHALARDRQVLCVTHLPQIAAWADAHLRIEKSVRDGRTTTAVTELTGHARVAELAAMIAGGAGSPAAEAAAHELLARAGRDPGG